ncbi:MAG: response regulator [Cyclobacteriaceae bacterium]
MTILLVDDDDDDRDVFQEAASVVVPGVKCIVAKDGEQGLSQLKTLAELPDYIFLDVNMPKMDGKEFLKLIKEHPVFKGIPVIIYSTSNHTSELGNYFKMGASNFITKPSEFDLLLTYLKTVLK